MNEMTGSIYGRQRRIYFQYNGKTALRVVGPFSGRQYRFERPGAIVAVEYRDRQEFVVLKWKSKHMVYGVTDEAEIWFSGDGGVTWVSMEAGTISLDDGGDWIADPYNAPLDEHSNVRRFDWNWREDDDDDAVFRSEYERCSAAMSSVGTVESVNDDGSVNVRIDDVMPLCLDDDGRDRGGLWRAQR